MSNETQHPQSTTPPAAPRVNLYMSTLGAILGAGLVGACWMWLAHIGKPNHAWGLGILLGGCSGFLAAWLGHGKRVSVGTIAALVTTVTIVVSAYSAYSFGLRSDAGHHDYQMKFADQVDLHKTKYLVAGEYESAFAAYLAKKIEEDSNPAGFIRWMGEKGTDAMVPILMMICGVFFAFLTGGGSGCSSGQCRTQQ